MKINRERSDNAAGPKRSAKDLEKARGGGSVTGRASRNHNVATAAAIRCESAARGGRGCMLWPREVAAENARVKIAQRFHPSWRS